MNKRPIIFSFFAGAGFLDLGFELNGFNIAYVNDIFPQFMHAYSYSRQCLNLQLPEYGHYTGEKADVSKLIEGQQALELRELMRDCRDSNDIVGFIGSPCPDFSVGGKNRGQKGDNGKLSASYIELICQQKPDFFLFENVKGLWSTKKHRLFFEALKYQLQQSGYVLVERLINALEYGVPQDRARIILIGFHSNLINNSLTKFDIKCLLDWDKHTLYQGDKLFSYPWSSTNFFREDSIIPCPDGIPQELTVEYWFRKNDVLNHANSEHYFKPRAGLARFASVNEGDDSKKSFKRLHRWRYSPTACYGNNEVHLHPYKIRRISVAEALAIQSLPKNFVFPSSMSLTNMFKAIGNGVPYLAGKSIALTILEFLTMIQGFESQSTNKKLELAPTDLESVLQ